MNADVILIDSKTAGSRAATRVRVAAPQGSAFDGRRGTVVREDRPNETVMVRLDGGSTVLPFHRAELTVTA